VGEKRNDGILIRLYASGVIGNFSFDCNLPLWLNHPF